MAIITPVGGRAGLTSTPPQQSAETMRRKERGTSLAEAVVLERDKQGRGQRRDADEPEAETEQHDREPREHDSSNNQGYLNYTKSGFPDLGASTKSLHTTEKLDLKA